MEYKFLKIGFSLGRCVRDIVNGKIEINQVVVIISRTRLKNVEQLRSCITAYQKRDGYLAGMDLEACLTVGQELWDRCLLFQPRLLGSRRVTVPEEYVWLNLIPEAHEHDPVISHALNKYLLAIKLIGSGEQQETIVR